MHSTENKLGQALAFLTREDGFEDEAFPEEQKVYLRQLKNRIELLGTDGQLQHVLVELPHTTCDSTKPFLLNNDEFFLAFFSASKSEDICDKLFTHLNSCYSCFEIFTNVLNDFCGQLTAQREN